MFVASASKGTLKGLVRHTTRVARITKDNIQSVSFARCYMKFIRNLPDVKYTSLSLLYFPAFNGEPNKSNNSIKKLIVQATFKNWAGARIKTKETFINCARI